MSTSLPTKSLPTQPAVSLTTLGFGGAQAGNLGQVFTEAGVRESFETAWEAGIRYIDTAPHYGLGLSEHRLGALLGERPREEFVISTKVGRLLVPSPETADQQDPDGFSVPADHRREWDLSGDGIRRSIAESLERTGLDYLDIAYLHDPEDRMEQALTEAIPALTQLRDEGVVRAVGVGMNFSAPLARFANESDIDVVLCAGRYTLLDQAALADLLPAALANNVGVVIGGVYNSGLLAVPRPSADATFNYAPASRELLTRTNTIADVCERHGVTLPQAALAFVRSHPAVVSTVVGMRTSADVAEAIERSAATMPAELWDDLRSASLIAPDAPTDDPA